MKHLEHTFNKVFPLSTHGGLKNFNSRSNRSQIALKINGNELGGESWVNPLPDEASRTKRENQKKKTRFAGLFFLTGLRPVLPLGQC